MPKSYTYKNGDPRIKNSIKNMETAIKALRALEDGTIRTKKSAADIIGITPQELNTFLNENFKTPVRKAISSKDEIRKLRRMLETPAISILQEVFRMDDENPADLPYFDEDYFWDEWLGTALTPREEKIVKMCYIGNGTWRDPHPMTLAKIGDIFGIGHDRVRQIREKTIWKIAQALRGFDLFLRETDFYEEMRAMKEERGKILQKMEAYQSEMRNSMKELTLLREELEQIQKAEMSEEHKAVAEFKDLIEQASEKLKSLPKECFAFKSALSTKIEDMDLSIRSYNCLKRGGLNTISDILAASRNGRLATVRNLGRKSAEEVIGRIKKIHPCLAIENPFDKPSDSLEKGV